MSMDLTLMRSLVAVADAGAITEAAERLGVTQPALSRRIRSLEQHLGVTLLERGRRGVRLTSVGRLVESEARDLLARYERLRTEVAAHVGLAGGTVRLGGGATAVSFVLPSAIAGFQSRHPAVRFVLKEAGSREVESDVAAGRLELGLVTLPVRRDDLIATPLLEDEVVLICRQDHPLARAGRVQALQLAGLGLVGFEAGSAIRHIVDESLRRAGVEMNVVMELRSIAAIVRMVATTGNVAFVSSMGVEAESGVQVVPVDGLAVRRTLALIERRGAVPSPAARAFAGTLLPDARPGAPAAGTPP